MNFPKEIDLDLLEKKFEHERTIEFCARLVFAVFVIAMLLGIAQISCILGE